MAQVKEFELLHGVVLTKLLRTDGAALRLVETDSKKAWAAYRVNDEVNIYVKYRLQNRETKKEQKLVWSFVFSDEELAKITELRAVKPVWLALVCGLPEITTESLKAMQVCLLDPVQIDGCINVGSSKSQALTVEYKPGASLRAYGPLNSEQKQKLVVSRNRLDEWTVPGS
jgi:hypothetical protein